jgi:hypothetical protein
MGDDTDHYDFLDLYTRGWFNAERAVKKACKARNMTTSSLDDQTRRRGSETGGGDLPKLTARQTTGGLPERMTRPFFNRTYQPYDWNAKAGTEVSAP